MANAHRTNVMITSCLKTPVDPHTKAPLALYERERTLPYTSTSHMDNRDYEKEREFDGSCSERGDGDSPAKGAPLRIAHQGPRGRDRIDLRDVYFSNEEYYRKLEELKEAHLRTMAELEGMYRKKLDHMEGPYLLPWRKSSPAATHRLTRSHSALELRRGSGPSDEEGACPGAADNDVEKGLLSSPKEHIKNMWRDFKLSPRQRRPSSSSLRSLPGGRDPGVKGRGSAEREAQRPRATVPEPFGMTLREAERRRGGAKTRSEAALESAGLRRRLEEEELAECRRQFRASPVPAHVRLPLFEELRGRAEERRRTAREREEGRLRAAQRPFSFLERERLKREQREEEMRRRPPQSDQEGAKPFKAKPVPRAVYEAASGDLMKEEELYRAIKSQMRARDLLDSASMPASMQARSLGAGRRADGGAAAAGSGDDSGGRGGASPHLHRPKIHTEVPDFDASYRRFRKRLEEQRDVKPVTACEPFRLRTSQIAARRKDRAPADAGGDQAAVLRWPGVRPGGPALTPGSSRCSSLSGSLELLPAKATDAARKRQEAVRKMLEQRRKAEEEEERWRVRQKQREKRLQKMVSKRAQANDPHLALSQTCQTRLKEFRKQDLQRRKEYKEEMREIQQRVKGRPLLLEQVAHMNARQAAEKRYTDALRGCGLSEDFVSGKVPKAQRPESPGSAGDAKLSDSDAPVVYNKVYLDGSDDSESKDEDGDRDEAERRDRDSSDKGSDSGDGADHQSDGGYHYSDDDEHYSEDGEQRLSGDVRNEDGDIKKCQSGLGMGSSQHRPNSQNADSKSRAISDQKSDKED